MNHKDNHDCSNGLCWVVPYGDYLRAYSLFPDLAISINTTSGDVLCFKSKLLEHETTDFTGTQDLWSFFQATHLHVMSK